MPQYKLILASLLAVLLAGCPATDTIPDPEPTDTTYGDDMADTDGYDSDGFGEGVGFVLAQGRTEAIDRIREIPFALGCFRQSDECLHLFPDGKFDLLLIRRLGSRLSSSLCAMQVEPGSGDHRAHRNDGE